ncbi:MAG: glutamine--tRNA ligase, partial [Planctomycetota bacterium]
VVELRCTYDPRTAGGQTPEGEKKVKGIVHWVSADHAFEAEVRLYDHLFSAENPNDFPEGGSLADNLNPDSLEVLQGCKLEPSLSGAEPGQTFQFERLGYFCVDTRDSTPGTPVFHRTVSLRDTWGKIERREKKGE